MNSVSISLINLIVLILLTRTESFTLKHTFQTQLIQKPTTYRLGPIYLFGKGKDESKEVNGDDQPNEKKSSTFFGRLKRQKGVETVEVATVEKIEASPVKESEDPAAMAKTLRAQAERARLEAERMDAELTLQKIEKLERELVQAKNKGDSVEDLQRQLDNLQAKLRGEPPKPVVAKTTAERRIADKDTDVVVNDTNTPPATISSSTSYLGDLEFQDLEETIELVERSPGFIRKLMASIVELEYDTKADLNKTEIAVRLSKMATADYSYSSLSKPVFTKEQISEAAKKIDEKSSDLGYPSNFVKLAEGNVTKLAEYALEYEYYLNSRIGDDDQALQLIAKVGEDEEWMQGLLSALNQTSVDRSIETLYPKCTRKEGEEPTMAQIQSLAANVLPSAKFSSSSKPEKVLGGYVIRGSHKYESGDDLIEAIDRELAKTSLGDKMTVLYTPDFTVFAQADEDDFDLDLFDPAEIPPVLYITGPDIARERQQLLLSVTSAFGLATSWYLSIYPFLLNPALAKRVDEQLVLADASMSYDLAWLTDLSVPLFLTFIGIQLSHELAHRVVGSFSDMKLSAPTFVPSIITGTTSTVTTFKAPPKNKEAMFDFSVAGPLVGILASVGALVLGSQLTLVSDPATLPALPLEILRQSTLGGGIIDGIVQGSLYVPPGAPMAGVMISLHPVAIAGYISLVVNALSLLPVGTTDGGRVGLTLFGRPAKLVVGNLFLFTLLLTGLLGSDLFLFYFAFVLAFQTGNEIPSRNEVDNISFPRIVVATLAYCLAFLSLVPFQ